MIGPLKHCVRNKGCYWTIISVALDSFDQRFGIVTPNPRKTAKILLIFSPLILILRNTRCSRALECRKEVLLESQKEEIDAVYSVLAVVIVTPTLDQDHISAQKIQVTRKSMWVWMLRMLRPPKKSSFVKM